MEEQIKTIQNKVSVLSSWINEMKMLVENPYSNGINTDRMLKDLGGFADDLSKSIDQLATSIPQPENEANSASVEQ